MSCTESPNNAALTSPRDSRWLSDPTLDSGFSPNALVPGARFGDASGLTAWQLYSTASYQQRDLTRISLAGAQLDSWNFEGQHLADSSFHEASVSGSNFRGANLQNARFLRATISGLIFDEADLRGTMFLDGNLSDNSFDGADLRGVTWSAGELAGLWLGEDFPHIVFGPDRWEPTPAPVTEGFTVTAQGNLEVSWEMLGVGSPLTFPADVPPSLAGTLTISLDPARVLPVGRTRQLFAWGKPLDPTDRFDQIEVPRGTQWDFSQLYTTGEVVLLDVVPFHAGDTDQDYDFDQQDIVQVLQAAEYQSGRQAIWREGDWDGDGVFDQDDIVAALQTGSYLQGYYVPLAVDAVFAAVGA